MIQSNNWQITNYSEEKGVVCSFGKDKLPDSWLSIELKKHLSLEKKYVVVIKF
ncbi:hypothetical protein LEP1GSC017_3050 [Leptospira meyeri serovar Hardjo str. Went 5]|nr:hypothetical protein LEP1GSC017_3050 [Leptospira meyeri serovar Hardjo str. Went 5]EMJ86675.1 hypothetical protein LEP1GSC196_3864 [Leptospira meyeri serovar Semaranga str. Veldrot Semarang 173]